MQKEKMILANDFCVHHNVEIAFVHSLHDSGLIHAVVQQEQYYLPEEELLQLEKLTRLHYDLDINLEGIEAIAHLLQNIDHMHGTIAVLQNRLRFYNAAEGE